MGLGIDDDLLNGKEEEVTKAFKITKNFQNALPFVKNAVEEITNMDWDTKMKNDGNSTSAFITLSVLRSNAAILKKPLDEINKIVEKVNVFYNEKNAKQKRKLKQQLFSMIFGDKTAINAWQKTV